MAHFCKELQDVFDGFNARLAALENKTPETPVDLSEVNARLAALENKTPETPVDLSEVNARLMALETSAKQFHLPGFRPGETNGPEITKGETE